ncbi:MAG: TetM/TetW/TetO/TetS family tetracycline resistance ribosomal protection protein [Thermomicrobiales bacterium]
MPTPLNLGILAHVDAGKTSLTERILFETGVIHAIGRVDRGTTQTDTLDLERQRGITIRSAVVAFTLGGLHVNLIDTPGHADFIAEVERALLALDAVVLVISAVEGVQPQTRRLARAVRSLGLPMVVFVNKIDRLGARVDAVLDDIRDLLGLRVVPMTEVRNAGTRAAEAIPRPVTDIRRCPDVLDALSLDRMGADLVDAFITRDGNVSSHLVSWHLRKQVAAGIVVPVFAGAAITGAGVPDLLDGISSWLPAAAGDADAPLSGTVFTVQRTPSGEKLAFVRLFDGSVALRQVIGVGRRDEDGAVEIAQERVTALDRYQRDGRAVASAGEIVRLHGLRSARVGDWIGREQPGRRAAGFRRPTMESVVSPHSSGLFAALQCLAESDPLIGFRHDERRRELSVRLFGEVQKEVLAATLASDFGLEVSFAPSRVVCVERPIGTGYAIEHVGAPGNPFAGTVGIRVEPGELDSGIVFRRPSGALPLAFYVAIEETISETLREGLHGWEVRDIRVTLTETAYASPVTVAGDFRKLTPLVLMAALKEAGTRVCEPILRFDLETPEPLVGDALPVLVANRAVPEATEAVEASGRTARIVGTIPAAEVHAVEQRLAGLTRGEGVLTTAFASYAPVTGPVPERDRSDHNPLNRAWYLAQVAQG